MSLIKMWTGSKITTCNLCDSKLESVFIDGRLRTGQWAIMCRPCHKTLGVGVGTGKGQLYSKINGNWIKKEG